MDPKDCPRTLGYRQRVIGHSRAVGRPDFPQACTRQRQYVRYPESPPNLDELGSRGMASVLVEGGAALITSMVRERRVMLGKPTSCSWWLNQ